MRPGAYTFTNSKGIEWTLHKMDVVLRNGHKQVIYYFAQHENTAFSIDEIPAGMRVMETTRTGMPVLKKN